MKKIVIICNLCFISLIYSQITSKKITINTGIEYRVSPFDFNNSLTYAQDVDYNRDKQLSGLSILAGIEYEFFKNFHVGLAQSVRYDEKYFSDKEDKMVEGLIFDTHLELKYFFMVNSHNVFALLGYSFMNNNTSYKETKVFQTDENGNPISSASLLNDFSFNAYKFGVGYNVKKLDFILGIYYIPKEHNFSKFGTSAIGMPFLQVKYNIVKF